MTVFCIDIDGTLTCGPGFNTFSREEILGQIPYIEMIVIVNGLYEMGHTIILHTARLWSDFSTTSDWLKQHSVKYHTLVMGKPLAHYYIDDKNMSIAEFLEKDHKDEGVFVTPPAMIENEKSI